MNEVETKKVERYDVRVEDEILEKSCTGQRYDIKVCKECCSWGKDAGSLIDKKKIVEIGDVMVHNRV